MSIELCRGAFRALLVAGSIAAGIMSQPAFSADPISVFLDEAKLMKLPERATTLVVGNPLIADVTVQPGGILVVTAKGYGQTNVMALDRAGTVVMDRMIEVIAPEKLVTVYRGVGRETYSCSPDCQRRVMIGDVDAYFAATMGQTTTRAAAAAAISDQSQGKD